jgi:hypothetical protein
MVLTYEQTKSNLFFNFKKKEHSAKAKYHLYLYLIRYGGWMSQVAGCKFGILQPVISFAGRLPETSGIGTHVKG